MNWLFNRSKALNSLAVAIMPEYCPPLWCSAQDREGLLILRKNHDLDCIPDEELVRFLRSSKYNLRKTARLLDDHLWFLEKYQPSTILMSMVKNPMRTGCWRLLGRDRFGRPIIWARASLYKLDECSVEEFMTMAMWFFDQAARMCNSHSNGEPCQIAWLFDFGEYSGTLATLNSHSSASIQVVQNHFPGLISTILVVRANWVFHRAFKALKPFINEGFASTIRFLDNRDMTQQLLKVIEPEVLPKMYGGQASTPPCPNIPNLPNLPVQ
eukprot:c12833_g1_i1.p1 GENE.c12833_g1_i1~~c12833_g1_i1.p1  ORF type:complete len:269 (-),score=30.07 c12833_g1_i1:33-839(-)